MRLPKLPHLPKFPKIPKLSTRKEKAHQKQKATSTEYVIEVRIENGSRLYFKFGPEASVTRHPEPLPGFPLVSAVYPPHGKQDDDTADDHRLNLTKKMSARAAASFVQREVALFYKVQAIVIGTTVHATPAAKIKNATDPIIPLSIAVEHLMERSGVTAPAVTGVMFGDNDLLVLMAYPGNGRVHAQTSVAPENIEEVVSSFASTVGIPNESGFPIFTQDELIDALGESESYPSGGLIGGVPIGTAANALLGISVVAAAGSGAWYAYAEQRVNAAESAAITYKKTESESVQKVAKRIAANRAGFGKLLSADYSRGIAHAQAFWIKGGRVESDIAHGTDTHTIFLPVFKNAGEIPLPESRIVEAINKGALPKGCTHNGTTLAGDMNEIQAKYTCVGVGSPLDDFGG